MFYDFLMAILTKCHSFHFRCFLGENVGPAQWPDANRYMEALITKLCDTHPIPVKEKGRLVTRWSLICRDYANIVRLILNCPNVIRDTRIQLHDINKSTLQQWYNRTAKLREQTFLQQGIPAPSAPSVATQRLPAPVTQPAIPHQSSHAPQHVFILPPDSAGQAVTGPRRLPLPIPSGQIQRPLIPILPQPTPGPSNMPALPAAMPCEPELTRKQRFHIRRKQKLEEQGIHVKKYVRRAESMTCKQCGQARDANHRQYYGKWFCPDKSGQPYEQWLAEQKQARQEKKGN